MDPGPLGIADANKFRSGTYTQKILQDDTVMYRVYRGVADKAGAYLSKMPQGSGLQPQLDLALNPAWGNSTENIVKVVIPKGSTIFEGIAVPKNIVDSIGKTIGTLPGGGNQIFISNIDARWFR